MTDREKMHKTIDLLRERAEAKKSEAQILSDRAKALRTQYEAMGDEARVMLAVASLWHDAAKTLEEDMARQDQIKAAEGGAP